MAKTENKIIAQNKKFICFVEVKTRSVNSLDRPAAAVDYRKQRRIITTAEHFLMSFPSDLQPRFDVAEVITDNGKVTDFNFIENAFDLT